MCIRDRLHEIPHRIDIGGLQAVQGADRKVLILSVSYTHLDVYKRQILLGYRVGAMAIVPGRNSLLKSLFLFFGRKDIHKL